MDNESGWNHLRTQFVERLSRLLPCPDSRSASSTDRTEVPRPHLDETLPMPELSPFGTTLTTFSNQRLDAYTDNGSVDVQFTEQMRRTSNVFNE